MDDSSQDTTHTETSEEHQKGGFWSEVVKFALVAVLIVLPFRLFIAQPFIVSGGSMDPTFANGQYLIVDQVSYKIEAPHRGDVVIFKYPIDKTKYFIKRVIGLPGETVKIEEGIITIYNDEHPNGVKLKETYIDPNNFREDDTEVTLGKGEFYVLGDNRNGSSDSRAWGPITKNLILGRPFVRLLPAETFAFFPGRDTKTEMVTE